jgi:hypothetical protein
MIEILFCFKLYCILKMDKLLNPEFCFGRSRVRDPMRRMNFSFSLPDPSSRTRPRVYSAEMSTRSRKIMFVGSKARPVRWADSLAAICDPIV